MKTTYYSLMVAAFTLLMAGNAFAAGTTRVYSSGILVLAFLGFCALVVVIQLIPALMTLWGMLKSLMNAESKKAVEANVEE